MALVSALLSASFLSIAFGAFLAWTFWFSVGLAVLAGLSTARATQRSGAFRQRWLRALGELGLATDPDGDRVRAAGSRPGRDGVRAPGGRLRSPGAAVGTRSGGRVGRRNDLALDRRDPVGLFRRHPGRRIGPDRQHEPARESPGSRPRRLV